MSCCAATFCSNKQECWRYAKCTSSFRQLNSKNGRTLRNTKEKKKYLAAAIWVVLQNRVANCIVNGWCFMGHHWELVLPTLSSHPQFPVPTKIFLVLRTELEKLIWRLHAASIKITCWLLKWEWQFHKKCGKFVQITNNAFVNWSSCVFTLQINFRKWIMGNSTNPNF